MAVFTCTFLVVGAVFLLVVAEKCVVSTCKCYVLTFLCKISSSMSNYEEHHSCQCQVQSSKYTEQLVGRFNCSLFYFSLQVECSFSFVTKHSFLFDSLECTTCFEEHFK